MDPKTGARRPFAAVAPPETTGADWIHRLKLSSSGTTIGFSYIVRQSKVLMLSWADGATR